MENIKIWCETEKEKNEVLKKLQEQGFRWNSGHNPTEWKHVAKAPMGLFLYDEHISQRKSKKVFDAREDLKKIKVNEYLGKSNLGKSKQEIHITTDGKNTYAIMKENGKVVKRAVAKCCSEDEFDFEEGSRLAFERLFGEKVKGLVHACFFKEGGSVSGININDIDLANLALDLISQGRVKKLVLSELLEMMMDHD